MIKVQLELKFEIDDQVRVKDTNEIGTIKAYKIEGYKFGGQKQHTIYYQVQIGALYNIKWFKEEKIELIDEIATNNNFNDEFELGFIDLLINIYLLDKKNIPLVKKLHNEKQLYN
jgi:hypothetical protein